jgi:hypothetical protein
MDTRWQEQKKSGYRGGSKGHVDWPEGVYWGCMRITFSGNPPETVSRNFRLTHLYTSIQKSLSTIHTLYAKPGNFNEPFSLVFQGLYNGTNHSKSEWGEVNIHVYMYQALVSHGTFWPQRGQIYGFHKWGGLGGIPPGRGSGASPRENLLKSA